MQRIIYITGIVACAAVIICCFFPWTYYDDLSIPAEADRLFTGFYSYKKSYGRPGMFIVPLSIIVLLFMLIPKIWAKRVNLFLAALLLGFVIKTYVLFVSCYRFICPDKKPAIYILLFSVIFILVAAIFPYGGGKIPENQKK